MDRELIFWALINDRKQMNKKDVIDVISKSGSIDNIFNKYDMIKLKELNKNTIIIFRRGLMKVKPLYFIRIIYIKINIIA